MASTFTVGIAWNGKEPLLAAVKNASEADFVDEILVAPSTAKNESEAAQLCASFPKLRVLPGGDSGIYSAFSKLIAAARTTHLCFHGADDFIRKSPAISAAIRTLPSDTSGVFSIAFCRRGGAPYSVYHHEETLTPTVALARYTSPATPEIAYSVNALRLAGGADSSFRIAGDADLYFRARRHFARLDFSEIFVDMHDGGASTTARNSRVVWLENRRIARKHAQQITVPQICRAYIALNGRYALYRLLGAAKADMVVDALRRLIGRKPRFSQSAE